MAKFARAEIRKIIGESCTDEKETALIALHHSIVDDVKDQLDAAKADAARYKAEADKLPGIQQELEGLKNGEDYKAKYEKEHADFDGYKKQIADSEELAKELAKKKAAYRKLLFDEHINEKRLDAVIRLTDFSGIKLDKDGNLQDVETLKKSIDEDWGDYKVTTRQRGANLNDHQAGDDDKGTKASDVREITSKWHAARYGKSERSEEK